MIQRGICSRIRLRFVIACRVDFSLQESPQMRIWTRCYAFGAKSANRAKNRNSGGGANAHPLSKYAIKNIKKIKNNIKSAVAFIKGPMIGYVMVKGHKNRQLDNVIKSRAIADDSIGNSELGSIQEKTLLFEYDFAVGGGTAGLVALTGKGGVAPTQIPDNAVITNVTVEGVTDNTSGGSATITIGLLGGPNDPDGLVTIENFNHAMWNVDAVTSGTPTVASGKTTAACAVTMTIGTADLTAGKWYVWVSYFEGA